MPWLNKLDPKYETYANSLLQQVIGAGYRVDEIRYILVLARSGLDKRINEVTLQSLPDSLP